ncbi:class I SAM-dependent methyltransferase [Streptomyces sp. NPDC003077]|uniref:class I SAM-dependent methyltransferase n=1 Tax=Streptomyces sp. NPDC003077 TaxID=3154443 RepID=UPI00339EF0EE
MTPKTMHDEVHTWYGPGDLSSLPTFAGGFINFGRWEGIDLDRPLTVADRVHSQRELYRHVLGTLGEPEALGEPGGSGALLEPEAPEALGAPGEPSGGRVLEVGCGLGLGCALAAEEFGFREVTGMDIHPQQLERARRSNAALLAARPPRLRFAPGAAERMPFANGEFDGLYTVEAAQHFRDLPAFAREAARVLRPGGRAVVTSFFVPDGRPDPAARLAGMLASFASGLDVAHPIGHLTDALEGAGLTAVRVTSIGASVWPGLDRWLSGLRPAPTWPRNFLRAYELGLLDYFTVTATRQPSPARPAGSPGRYPSR